MLDKYNRDISYIRISVTDHCNLRCEYCMPREEQVFISEDKILKLEEIVEIVRYVVKMGINKVRLTGGEPLLRKDIIQIVEELSKIEGLTDLGLTTNGILLSKYAKKLKEAGLHRINISMDTLNPERFKKLTRWGNLNDVLSGIEAAKAVNFFPIKINCVIKQSQYEDDATEIRNFCIKNNLQFRFIKEMNLESGQYAQVIGGDGGKCKICNRLRITSDAKIKPCLFSDIEYDIRQLGIEQAFMNAINDKPLKGVANNYDKFNSLGG